MFGRSFSFLNGWFVGSMLIFQGVTGPSKTLTVTVRTQSFWTMWYNTAAVPFWHLHHSNEIECSSACHQGSGSQILSWDAGSLRVRVQGASQEKSALYNNPVIKISSPEGTAIWSPAAAILLVIIMLLLLVLLFYYFSYYHPTTPVCPQKLTHMHKHHFLST